MTPLTQRTPDIQRILPHSEESERGLLSSYLRNPTEIGDLCAKRGITNEHFWHPCNAAVYEAINKMRAIEEPMDFITLTQYLRERGKLDLAGGAANVTELFSYLPTEHYAATYVRHLEGLKVLRESIRLLSERTEKLYVPGEASPRDLVIETIGALENIIRTTDDKIESRTKLAIQDIKERILQRGIGGEIAIKIGMKNIDDSLGGLMPSRYYVLGARPKIGKTALMESWAQHIMRQGGAVLFFQRDMSVEDMISRMACRAAGVVFEDFDLGRLSNQYVKRVTAELNKLDPDKLRIHSPANMTSEELGVIARRECRTRKIKAVFLDVFQKIRVRGNDRTEGLTAASQHIRDHVNDYGAPWVVAAHINKEADKTGRPTTSQFKYCDQLFADCDTAALMWSDEDPRDEATMKNKVTGEWQRQRIILSMDANRGGEVGDLFLYFDRPRMAFYQTREGDF